MRHLVAACLMLLPAGVHAEPLRLLAEEYPPYSFSTANGPAGTSVEQIMLMMTKAGLDYGIEIQPWPRAYANAQRERDTCVFTTRHDRERDGLFKWVEPLLVDRMVMIRKAGSGADPKTIDAAMAFRIGTQRNDTSATFLADRKFPYVDFAADMELTLKKLLGGRIDLMMTSQKTFETLRSAGHPIEQALLLEGGRYGLACHRDMPDPIIAKMQSALDDLIADGTQDRIFGKYGVRPNR